MLCYNSTIELIKKKKTINNLCTDRHINQHIASATFLFIRNTNMNII